MIDFEKNFDMYAEDYEASRPMYVKEIYDAIFKYKLIGAGSLALEIGIGSGKATLPILEKGCRVIGLEPGSQLAEITASKYNDNQNLVIHNTTLQEYECPPETYDLIYSATAFHWIPEEYGYPRVYELLKKGGAFARFAYSADPDAKQAELNHEVQEVYKKYYDNGGKGSPKLFDEEDAADRAKIAEKYGFGDTKYYIFHYPKDFTADEYMRLLRTYPDHMKQEEGNRQKLFRGIYDAIIRSGGVFTVYYTMDLELARK